MVEACLPEVRLAKAEVDNSIIIHHLTDALSKDFAQGDVGALDISTVQVKHLTERIEAVEDMGVQTAHAEQLLKAAKIVVRIRTAMVRVCVGMSTAVALWPRRCASRYVCLRCQSTCLCSVCLPVHCCGLCWVLGSNVAVRCPCGGCTHEGLVDACVVVCAVAAGGSVAGLGFPRP